MNDFTQPVGDEQERYYLESFNDVNYRGTVGFASRLAHRHLERGIAHDEHFSTVLELGAAHGAHLRYVRHGYDVFVLSDMVDRKLDLLDLKGTAPSGRGARRIEFQVQDAHMLELADRSVDRVLHTCLLHHLGDVDTALAEIRRVLRPGGIYTAYVPCDPGLSYRAVQRLTAGRAIKRVLRDGNYIMTPQYLRAREHPNHYEAIWATLRHTFRSDRISARHFPLPGPLWNLNFFSVATVVRGRSR